MHGCALGRACVCITHHTQHTRPCFMESICKAQPMAFGRLLCVHTFNFINCFGCLVHAALLRLCARTATSSSQGPCFWNRTAACSNTSFWMLFCRAHPLAIALSLCVCALFIYIGLFRVAAAVSLQVAQEKWFVIHKSAQNLNKYL